MSGGELAGRLREPILIQRRDDSRDALGGADGGWVDVAEAWAAFAPAGAGPEVAGDAIRAAARWRIIIRAGVAVQPGDRIARANRRIRVTRVIHDPATPDRIGLEGEDET